MTKKKGREKLKRLQKKTKSGVHFYDPIHAPVLLRIMLREWCMYTVPKSRRYHYECDGHD